MSEVNGKTYWEPQYNVPNGAVRPPHTLSPKVEEMRVALDSFAKNTKRKRADAWLNDFTGFGTDRDKTQQGYVLPDRFLTDVELSAIYHSDDMAARMVDIVPQEMLREPYSMETGDPDLDQVIADKHEELDVRSKFADGERWARAFGGGACLIGCDDGLDVIEPLRPERARDIDYLYPVDKRYIWPLSYYDRFGDKKLGHPKTYLVTTVGVTSTMTMEVHESRLIAFHGAHTGVREKMLLRGWEMSVIQRAYNTLQQFNTGWTAVEVLMTDASQGVFAISGLTEMLAAGATQMLQQRLAALDMYRSVLRAIVIDADRQETFERKTTSFAELPQTLDKFMLRLSASVEIPVTILMGQSPAGMNATGDSDFRWFYDRIRSQQNTQLAPRLRRITDVWLKTKTGRRFLGKAKDPKTLTAKFPPLWTEQPLAQAQRKLTIAQTDKVNIDAGIYTPEEVALHRGRVDGYDGDIVLDEKQLKQRESAISSQAAGEATTPEQQDADQATQMPDDKTAAPDATEEVRVELTPSDVATVTKVNEARKANKLPPIDGPDGDLFLPAFKAKYASTISKAAAADQGEDPNAPKQAPPSPFGAAHALAGALGAAGGHQPPPPEKGDPGADKEDGEGPETKPAPSPFQTGKLPPQEPKRFGSPKPDPDNPFSSGKLPRKDAQKLAACVLVFNGPLVLAVSRKDDTSAFGMPGGSIDPGETPYQAAIRECKEETGYDALDLEEVFTAEDSNGYTVTTFRANIAGRFGTTESGQVTWVLPQKLLDGPFGDYNRRMFAKLFPSSEWDK